MFLYSIATCNANTKAFRRVTMYMEKWLGAKYINLGATVLSNFQCWGIQLIWRTIGQGPAGLVGAGGDCLSFFSLPFFLPL